MSFGCRASHGRVIVQHMGQSMGWPIAQFVAPLDWDVHHPMYITSHHIKSHPIICDAHARSFIPCDAHASSRAFEPSLRTYREKTARGRHIPAMFLILVPDITAKCMCLVSLYRVVVLLLPLYCRWMPVNNSGGLAHTGRVGYRIPILVPFNSRAGSSRSECEVV